MVALIMAAIVLLAVFITVLSGGIKKEDGRLQIAASFYPVYSAVLRVTEGVDGVRVVNLTPSQTGCLHDYQLTPDNVIALQKADALVINGAGAESFLGDIGSNYPGLNVLDTSKGISLMEGGHDSEEHAQDEDGHGEYNEHIWTGPSSYIKQIKNLCDGLIGIDPTYADQYKANAGRYIREIEDVKSRLIAAVDSLPTKSCILFHGSLTYFAKELGLNPVASLSMGEETAISAADLADAAAKAKAAGKILLIYDDQYHAEYLTVARDAAYSRVLKLDTAVTGNGSDDRDSWITAMRGNLRKIKEICEFSGE